MRLKSLTVWLRAHEQRPDPAARPKAEVNAFRSVCLRVRARLSVRPIVALSYID